jgi:hypothetical protein
MADTTPTPPIEPTAIAEPLDAFLREVIQTLHTAVSQGMRAEDPAVAERSLRDCKEILDVIMAGNVKEWLGE